MALEQTDWLYYKDIEISRHGSSSISHYCNGCVGEGGGAFFPERTLAVGRVKYVNTL